MENFKLNKAFKLKVLVALAIAVTLSLGFYMTQEEDVIVALHLDQDVEKVSSNADTVEELLEEEGISVNKKGYINVSLDKELEDNMDIIIKSPKSYTISSASAELDVVSTYNTVEEVLSDSNITLGEDDYTYPSLQDKVSPGDKIEIFNVEEVVEVVQEEIPFETTVRKNSRLELGLTNVIQKGKEGLKEVETLKKYVNGKLVKEDIIAENTISEPTNNIVEKGSKDRIVTSRGDTSYRKAVVMSATAYDLSFESCGKRPGDKYYGITASGTKARPGVVAVDPRVIPLGTKLYIESLDGSSDYGFAVAEDTGGAIKGNKIDLFFHSSTDVKNFGRRNVKVYILD